MLWMSDFLFFIFLFIYPFILPHHKYNQNNNKKKIGRINLTMVRRPKGLLNLLKEDSESVFLFQARGKTKAVF